MRVVQRLPSGHLRHRTKALNHSQVSQPLHTCWHRVKQDELLMSLTQCGLFTNTRTTPDALHALNKHAF
jgi:hypothetical protein